MERDTTTPLLQRGRRSSQALETISASGDAVAPRRAIKNHKEEGRSASEERARPAEHLERNASDEE